MEEGLNENDRVGRAPQGHLVHPPAQCKKFTTTFLSHLSGPCSTLRRWQNIQKPSRTSTFNFSVPFFSGFILKKALDLLSSVSPVICIGEKLYSWNNNHFTCLFLKILKRILSGPSDLLNCSLSISCRISPLVSFMLFGSSATLHMPE